MIKIGIFGGTFDPPHDGHLRIAHAAMNTLGLAQVVFIPAKQPPHKLDDPISLLEHRIAMLELALFKQPDFIISLLEAMREGPSFTVDTLRELRRKVGYDVDIYFIMGMDSLVNFPTWHQPELIIKLCRLAVLERPGFDEDLEALEKQVPGLKQSVVMIPSVEIDISSSEIRERVRAHQPITDCVPPLVAEYIAQHRLYLGETEKLTVELG